MELAFFRFYQHFDYICSLSVDDMIKAGVFNNLIVYQIIAFDAYVFVLIN